MKKSLVLKTIVFTSVISFATACSCHKPSITLESIAITTAPTKVAYTVGESFSLSGMVVTASYSNDVQEDVTEYASSIEEGYTFVTTDVGQKEVVITYQEKTASFTISVSEVEPPSTKTLVSISVTHEPNKTIYVTGEQFDPAGLVITGLYDDESTEEITGYTLTQPDMSSPGTKLVVITYKGKTAEFNITVNNPAVAHVTAISVTQSPSKTTYYVGEAFTSAGMEITATYSDSTSKKVTGYSCSTPDTSTAGSKTVTVTYSEGGYTVTTTLDINVIAVVLDSIEITHEPDVLVFYQNEEVDYTGLVVTAKYNNGTQKTVTTYTVDSVDTSTLGPKVVTVRYSEGGVNKTATFGITVIERPSSVVLSSIAITKEALNKEFILGEAFDPKGLEITATYSDSSTSKIALSALDITANLDSVGTKSVGISYTEGEVTKNTSYDVSVLTQNQLYVLYFGFDDSYTIDEENHLAIHNRPDVNRQVAFKYHDVTFTNNPIEGALIIAPGGYIGLQFEEGDTNSLAKITSMMAQGTGQEYVVNIGYAGEEVTSGLFNPSEGFRFTTSVSTQKFASEPSYIGIYNPNDVDLKITYLMLEYWGGTHNENPHDGLAPYGFVSGITKYVDDVAQASDGDSSMWSQLNAITDSKRTAKYTYRQGNMVWDENGLVNEPKPFDVYVDVYIPTLYKDYFTIDAYIKDGSTTSKTEITMSDIIDVTHRATTMADAHYSLVRIKASNVSLWHAGGPFLFVDIDVDATGLESSVLSSFFDVMILTGAIAK